MKYLTGEVKLKVTKRLPKHFALIIEKKTHIFRTHCVCIIASYSVLSRLAHECALLGFTPVDDETSLGCMHHVEIIKFVHSVFSKTTSNVVAVIADNLNVKYNVDTEFGWRFIGCASYRFNLAMKDLVAGHEALVTKIHYAMNNCAH